MTTFPCSRFTIWFPFFGGDTIARAAVVRRSGVGKKIGHSKGFQTPQTASSGKVFALAKATRECGELGNGRGGLHGAPLGRVVGNGRASLRTARNFVEVAAAVGDGTGSSL